MTLATAETIAFEWCEVAGTDSFKTISASSATARAEQLERVCQVVVRFSVPIRVNRWERPLRTENELAIVLNHSYEVERSSAFRRHRTLETRRSTAISNRTIIIPAVSGVACDRRPLIERMLQQTRPVCCSRFCFPVSD